LTFNTLFILLVDNVSVSKWKTGNNHTYLHDISCCTKLFRSNISDTKLVSVMEVLSMKENFFYLLAGLNLPKMYYKTGNC